ncbi:MAG: hypothetical protein MK165_19490 [Pirellulaceae bacterium]|nr:hypothetical protein [Pirellulaceae bacterium]
MKKVVNKDLTRTSRLVYQERALVVFSGATYVTAGPELSAKCPVCPEPRTFFSTELSAHSIWLLVFRLWTFRKVIGCCQRCQTCVRFKPADLEWLAVASPEQLRSGLVMLRNQSWTWPGRLWVLAAVLLCWAPLLGTILFFFAWRQTRYMSSGLSIAILISAGILSLMMTSILLVGLTGMAIRVLT